MDQLKTQLAQAYAEEFLEVLSLSQLTKKSSMQRASQCLILSIIIMELESGRRSILLSECILPRTSIVNMGAPSPQLSRDGYSIHLCALF